MTSDAQKIRGALRIAVDRLTAEATPGGWWEGRLSASALATATAVTALAVSGDPGGDLVRRGAAWLAADQNDDGGWGDSPDSPSNLATTMLCVAALTVCRPDGSADCLARADEYLTSRAGPSAPERIAAILDSYGADRTFAAPILAMAAVAGLVPWDAVPELPFELAALPAAVHGALRLRVVSYALPALIAVGLAVHRNRGARNPFARFVRGAAEGRVLRKLETVQPSSGGFLEAVPLTSFVAMSLAAASLEHHPVAERCRRFIARSAATDGSWAIDSNLSVWLTSNALVALDAAGRADDAAMRRAEDWLAARQVTSRHPYTNAAPGGWAWTHLPGGVPDADDTARAVRVLGRTGRHRGRVARGVGWLLGLQNRDGGWPTFCRGWGKLPFDRSAPDVTAHALEALAAANEPAGRVRRAVARGVEYLRRTQQPDGSWIPLWFGNQSAPEKHNAVIGTSFAVSALAGIDDALARTGIRFLLNAQDAGGGWGGADGVPPSVEETALALIALAKAPPDRDTDAAVRRAAAWLAGRVEAGTWTEPAPVGLYFSRLWYSERLYPIIWTVEALGRALAREAP